MKLLRDFLIGLSSLLLLELLSGSVLAQTATITNLNYPLSVTYGNSAIITIRADIQYSWPQKNTPQYGLMVTLIDRGTSDIIQGNDVSPAGSPIPCGTPNFNPQGKTMCPVMLSSASGTEVVSFGFSGKHIPATAVWSLGLTAFLLPYEGNEPYSEQIWSNFTVTVKGNIPETNSPMILITASLIAAALVIISTKSARPKKLA